jgi:hypothetical protein
MTSVGSGVTTLGTTISGDLGGRSLGYGTAATTTTTP